jgi:hypothetical protein
MAQGLIDPAQPQAQNILTQAVRSRAATLPAASNSAFTEAMGPAPNVPQMLVTRYMVIDLILRNKKDFLRR